MVLLRMFEKVSRSLKYDFNFFFRPQTYIYIYGHHNRSLYPARAARAGNNVTINTPQLAFIWPNIRLEFKLIPFFSTER